MALEDRINQLRNEALAQGKNPVPASYQGVSKDRIANVLNRIDRNTPDKCDAVFALLDDQQDSWFTTAPQGIKFCDGATTSHIACHVGILQRGGRKLDREGRDYWLKPLWELGAIEKVSFDSNSKQFINGHPVAKSSNSSYRLSEEFKMILKDSDKKLPTLLDEWIKKEKIRQRLNLQAELVKESRNRVDTKHSDLIRTCCTFYVPHFLSGYELLYIDEADGIRMSAAERDNFSRAGIDISIADSIPDVLLWNSVTDQLWAIEAVISDGEVDEHKVSSLIALSKRFGKAGIGFTTAYESWSAAARRQGKNKNIAPNTYLWIQEDPSKHLLVEAFKA